MRWQILLLSFGTIIWGKCCMSGFALFLLSLMDTASPASHSQEGTYLLLKCSSVASGVLMLYCWEATLYSRMSLLFKENKTNKSYQLCAFKFIYKYGVKIFSHVVLLPQHYSTLCVTRKQAEIFFLQDCSLLLTSAEGLMWFQPEPPPFHLQSLSHLLLQALSFRCIPEDVVKVLIVIYQKRICFGPWGQRLNVSRVALTLSRGGSGTWYCMRQNSPWCN